jgi:hypothetical protein
MNMKTTYTRAIAIALLAGSLTIPGAFAQTTKTSYFMSSARGRDYMNPALHPGNGYIGIPGASNLYAGLTTNTFTLDNFLFPRDNAKTVTFMHKDVTAEQFLDNISSHNYLTGNLAADLLSFGFATGKAYWTFHLGARMRVEADIPRGFFELLKVGFAAQEGETETRHDLSGLSLSAKSYVEVGLGYSRSFLGKRLVVGVRPKLLLGVGEALLKVDQLEVAAGDDFWEIKSRASLEASAPGFEPEYDNEWNNLSGFDYDFASIPGYGVGVDLGASFQVLDLGAAGKLTATAAVNNIGFMKWSGKNSYHARTSETAVTIRPSDYSIHQDGEGSSIEDILDDAVDDLERGLDFFTDPAKEGEGRSSNLNVNVNLGLEYALFNDKLSAGVLFSSEQGEGFNTGQCTVSANYRPCSWFAASASYALVAKNASKSLGLALHVSPRVGPALFVASDCALAKIAKQGIPVNARDLNVQVGLAFNIGGGAKQ